MPRELTAADFDQLRKAVAYCPTLNDRIGLCALMVEWEQEMRARELLAKGTLVSGPGPYEPPAWMIGGGV